MTFAYQEYVIECGNLFLNTGYLNKKCRYKKREPFSVIQGEGYLSRVLNCRFLIKKYLSWQNAIILPFI